MASRFLDDRYAGLRKTPDQIVYKGYTPDDVWKQLAQKSHQTGQKITRQCPVCDTSIQHTDERFLICPSCNAPVEIFQVRHLTQNADTRIIYISVKGHHKEIRRIELKCLSCERALTTDETCTYTCEIQTYLTLEHQDNGTYIKRWGNKPESLREEKPEIPTRLPQTPTLDSQHPQHKQTQQQTQDVEHEGIDTQRTDDVEHPLPEPTNNDTEASQIQIPADVEHDSEHAPIEHNTDEDLALEFIETHLVADAQGVLPNSEIYLRYLKFLHRRKRTPLADRKLYKHIREGFGVEHTRRRIDGKRQYAFIGIRWRQTDTE